VTASRQFNVIGGAAHCLGAAAFVVICSHIGLAVAAEPGHSVYTTTRAKNCREIRNDQISSDEACKGLGDLIVLRQIDDDRETISVGRSAKIAAAEPAATQGFVQFNSTDNTVEWRRGVDGKPFAIIQRWHITDYEDLGANDRPRSVAMLVVTRLAPGPVCHVAYIDVAANADANALARHAADDWARSFDCKKDSIHVGGQRGRATELAMPEKR
jgi:hypothetical protein